jgi:hypothetical protein
VLGFDDIEVDENSFLINLLKKQNDLFT